MGSNGDLISRSALIEAFWDDIANGNQLRYEDTEELMKNAPVVDAVVLPKGRPGDYLEWETGIIGHTTIQLINAILICEDCVRYDLGVFAPTVDHENIVRIMSREEAEREIERRAEHD